MAYTTPKTDWDEAYTPSPQDMNRIEGNTQSNREEILLEESARIAADGLLETYIDEQISTEETARIEGDNSKLTKAVIGNNGGVGSIVSVTSTFQVIDLSTLRHTWTMPHSGVWFMSVYNLYFSGSSYVRDLGNGPVLTYSFWRIG